MINILILSNFNKGWKCRNYSLGKTGLGGSNNTTVTQVVYDQTEPSIGTLDHSMFVTDTNGTYAYRDTDDIFIVAHNDETQTAYQSLDDYTGYLRESHFKTAHIT